MYIYIHNNDVIDVHVHVASWRGTGLFLEGEKKKKDPVIPSRKLLCHCQMIKTHNRMSGTLCCRSVYTVLADNGQILSKPHIFFNFVFS